MVEYVQFILCVFALSKKFGFLLTTMPVSCC